MRMFAILVLALIIIGLSGCASVEEINAGFRRIDRLWEGEYKKIDPALFSRKTNIGIDEARMRVIDTFSDMGMKITASKSSSNIISSVNSAPVPLSLDEWKEVIAYENPRVKEIGGWMFEMRDDTSLYQVTSSARLDEDGVFTIISLGFRLDIPAYETYGIISSKAVPPMAIQKGASRFWRHFDDRTKGEKGKYLVKDNTLSSKHIPDIKSDINTMPPSAKPESIPYGGYSYGKYSYEAEKMAIANGCVTSNGQRPAAVLSNESQVPEIFNIFCRGGVMKIKCHGIGCVIAK